MFAAMWPISMTKSGFIVPMLKDGKAVSEFGVVLDEGGHWVCSEGVLASIPGGFAHDLQDATATLRKALGYGTKVRPTIFVPSGLAFAVGDNQGREAAVFVWCTNHGKGIKGFDKELPNAGQLFSPVQLKRLLTNARAK